MEAHTSHTNYIIAVTGLAFILRQAKRHSINNMNELVRTGHYNSHKKQVIDLLDIIAYNPKHYNSKIIDSAKCQNTENQMIM